MPIEHYGKATVEILRIAANARVQEITSEISSFSNRTVQDGPFKGMILPETTTWGNGDVCPKLLGTYEQELHVSIETCIARDPVIVANIGCAEGYYAVGLAMRLPDAHVYAFDIDQRAQATCYDAARINGVPGININGKCRPQDIANLVAIENKRSLFVIDIEGGELELLEKPSVIAALKNSDLIIECHDFIDPLISITLQESLEDTHHVQIIQEGPRDPSGISALRGVSSLDRWLAVCEFRPVVMNWIVALAKE